MSTKLTAYVWDVCASNDIKGVKLLVMLRLADFSSDEGISFPSIPTIARQTGAGGSTVRTALSELEKDGWLSKQMRRRGQRNTSNVYSLNVKKLQKLSFELASFHPSESDCSESDPSKSDVSESGGSENKKATLKPVLVNDKGNNKNSDPLVSDPSESGGRSISIYTIENSNISSSRNSSELQDKDKSSKFLSRHPDAHIFTKSGKSWGTADDLKTAEYIYQKVLDVNPTLNTPNWVEWANDIRLLRTQLNKTHREICQVFKWANLDQFWQLNILCPAKLRKQWNTLTTKMLAPENKSTGYVPKPLTDTDWVEEAAARMGMI